MKYFKGWSSTRGRATHLMEYEFGIKALCGAPIRLMPGDHLMPKDMEICDHCQRVQRQQQERDKK